MRSNLRDKVEYEGPVETSYYGSEQSTTLLNTENKLWLEGAIAELLDLADHEIDGCHLKGDLRISIERI